MTSVSCPAAGSQTSQTGFEEIHTAEEYRQGGPAGDCAVLCDNQRATWHQPEPWTRRRSLSSETECSEAMGEWSRGLLALLVALSILALTEVKALEEEEGIPEGEFVAGSFILTQKALNEAPYRYSRFLTEALERMELTDPPTKRDEENCNVKYKIEPSGEEITLQIFNMKSSQLI